MGYLDEHSIRRGHLFIRFVQEANLDPWDDIRFISGTLEDSGPGPPLQIEVLAGPSNFLVVIDGDPVLKEGVETGVSEVPLDHAPGLLEEIAQLESQFENAEFSFPEAGGYTVEVMENVDSRVVSEWFLRHKSFSLPD